MKPLELLSADRMTAAERAREIATILARSILRTYSENNHTERRVRLGFSPGKSVHTTALNAGEMP